MTIEKVEIEFNGCKYNVYPINTRVSINGFVSWIVNIYHRPPNDIVYQTYGNTQLFRDEEIEKRLLTKIDIK